MLNYYLSTMDYLQTANLLRLLYHIYCKDISSGTLARQEAVNGFSCLKQSQTTRHSVKLNSRNDTYPMEAFITVIPHCMAFIRPMIHSWIDLSQSSCPISSCPIKNHWNDLLARHDLRGGSITPTSFLFMNRVKLRGSTSSPMSW